MSDAEVAMNRESVEDPQNPHQGHVKFLMGTSLR
jgi:hypothetical protein